MLRRRWSIALVVAALGLVFAIVATTGKAFGAKSEPLAFETEMDKASYAIGVNLARQFKLMAGDLDVQALAQGFADGRAPDGKTRLTNEDITATLAALRKTYQQKVQAAHTSADKPVTGNAGISVFFKLDPRLTASYGGDRWVSPPTYTRVGDATGVVIDARGQARNGANKAAAAPLQWSSPDPGMIQVTPDKGGAVSIAVKRAGTSSIRIASGALTKELAVKAESNNNALTVEISQK
jgi:FKBP-type peptidyl-prolyl isomerase-like protein